MRYPKTISEGGTIGFVAPSFGCSTEPYRAGFDRSLETWHERGYKTLLGPNCYASDGIGISSTPESCGRELTEGYCSGESDVIVSCGGGELMCETISHVDFDRVRAAEPKWYMGYSDNTNFTFTLTTMCDVASIYGPCASNFGTSPLHQSYEDAWSIMCGGNRLTNMVKKPAADADPGKRGNGSDRKDVPCHEFSGYGKWEKEGGRSEDDPYAPLNLTEKTVLHRYVGDGRPMSGETDEPDEIVMEGRLLGGCLDCLVNLCGTKFDHVSQFNEKYGDDGIIWFLEACDLNVFAIRRGMWELEQAGWFDRASGFVIGRPLQFGTEMFGLDQYAAVYDVITSHKVPVLMDADVGHLSPMVPLITGSIARVRARGNDWTVRMELR
mgnify:CR=1 FL=1